MAGPVPRDEYPLWVRIGIWGVPGRTGMWAFAAFSLTLAVAGAVAGFWFPPAFLGVLFIFSALWYWLSIRWVDRYGSWSES